MNTLDTPELVRKALRLGAVQVPEEIAWLIDLVKEQQPTNILEIGSESGGTFYLWCRLAAVGGFKISLDFPSGGSGSGRFVENSALIERTKEFKCWASNVHVVTGDSHEQKSVREVAAILGSNLLDFLFVDGDHSYEGVKADYVDYRGFVRPGGLIAFHDIKDTEHHRIRGCFVSKFWKELQGDKKEFGTDMHWGGIGVIRV